MAKKQAFSGWENNGERGGVDSLFAPPRSHSLTSGDYAKLVEVRICVDKFFNLLNCPPDTSRLEILSANPHLAWTSPCPNVFVVSL
ncbi:hypothetical protein EGR_06792 [Echinococcus granulosus]|uniref:Uncharacterized protein n=1 Tax=Echinococcus granulosus TaxID=6210 RepID=W6UBA9_ECHGR|nr:hypothetical protein EGR_06792 [Echinococcus granulosus]EUB58385.1 hypothetical protein EGR_06792 [Echinococcus granulosus]